MGHTDAERAAVEPAVDVDRGAVGDKFDGAGRADKAAGDEVKNKIFGAKWVSTIPLAIQQTRLIVEADRRTIRSCFSVMALPGPIA